MDVEFKIGGPVVGKQFYGRKELLMKISTGIKNNNFALMGQRRTGKTSLMFKVGDLHKKHFTIVYFDVGTVVPISPENFLREFLEHIIEAFSEQKGELEFSIKFKKFLRGAKGFLLDLLKTTHISIKNMVEIWFEYTQGKKDLTQVVKAVFELPEKLGKDNNIHFLILLDEFPTLLKLDDEDLIWAIRSYIHRSKYSHYIISGSSISTMNYLTSEKQSPFYGTLITLPIGEMDEKSSKKLISNLTNYGINPTGEFIKSVIETTGKHPYYLQAMCIASFWYAHGNKRKKLADSDIDECKQRTLDVLEGHFDGIFSKLKGFKESIIVIMACEDLKKAKNISVILDKDESYVLTYLKRLENEDYIKKVEKGTYVLIDNMFKEWVKKRFGNNVE